MKQPRAGNKRSGFTLIELIVVIAIIGIFAALLVPALCHTKPHGMQCLSNQKQLIAAAIMYADDNQGNWVPNFPGQSPSWVSGAMNWDALNKDNTNSALLVNAAVSVLGPYARDPRIYRCPGDYTYVAGRGNRVRSVSMNHAVGTIGVTTGQLTAGSAVNGQWLTGVNIGNSKQSAWRTYGKTASMTIPSPTQLWVFADEHPNSMNDASFAVQMAQTGLMAQIISYPGSYHDGAGGFSFADGHAELHKWTGVALKPPVTIGGNNIGNGTAGTGVADQAGANDYAWLQSHTSASTQ